MDPPDQLPQIDLPSPTTTILTLTKFHATLATLLLATTTTADRHAGLVSALAYVHFWSATLGFAWWYAAHSSARARACLRAG